MNTYKHTPGPWQQHDNHPEFGPSCAAVVWTSGGPGHGMIVDCSWSGGPTQQQILDAKLIAAAPEMLAALMACVEPVEPGGDCPLPPALYNLVCEVIAKATGKEPR